MGAMITQHPDLMRAVVSQVGIYDMLRVELAPNGAFNVTEFGSVKDPEQFNALYAYSPYHHVVDGTKYPSILMMTGANDGRVAPYHSRKMIARLDEANKSENPILLRTSSSAGHGIGTALNERIKQLADIYAFLFTQLGTTSKAPVIRDSLPGSGGLNTDFQFHVCAARSDLGLPVNISIGCRILKKSSAANGSVIFGRQCKQDLSPRLIELFKESPEPTCSFCFASSKSGSRKHLAAINTRVGQTQFVAAS